MTTVEQFQIGPKSYAEAIRLPGSGGCYMIRRFYLTGDSPTGAYTTGEPAYIRARSAFAAVSDYLASLNG